MADTITIVADEFMISRERPGMFEILTVDGKPRFALREGMTTDDLAAFIDQRVIAAVRLAQRKRCL